MIENLPTGWEWTKIGEICKTASGGTPSRKNSKYYNGEIPWLKSGELQDSYIFSTQESITELGLKSSSAKIFDKGDILIALYGATVGRLGILGIQASTNQAICAIKTPSILEKKYLFWFLKYIRNSLLKKRIGGAQPNISQQIIRNTKLPLPPFQEQHHIVAKIEELFAKLDAGLEDLKQVQTQLKRYHQSVLKAAVEGRFTADWREQHKNELEPADKLLERIQEERKAKLGSKFKKPIPTNVSNLHELPDGWKWSSLEQIAKNFDGQRIPVRAKDRAKMQGEYPYYGASGIIDYVNKYLFDGEYLLIAEDGANLISRSTPIAFIAEGKFWVNNHAHVIQAYGNIPLKFLELFFNGFDLRFYVTGTAQPKLTQNSMKKIPIPIPPLDEQEQIMKKVDSILSLIEGSNSIIETEFKRVQSLRQSILKHSFEGKLVPQDPSDEPASVLLERIKAAKAKSKKSKQLEMF